MCPIIYSICWELDLLVSSFSIFDPRGGVIDSEALQLVLLTSRFHFHFVSIPQIKETAIYCISGPTKELPFLVFVPQPGKVAVGKIWWNGPGMSASCLHSYSIYSLQITCMVCHVYLICSSFNLIFYLYIITAFAYFLSISPFFLIQLSVRKQSAPTTDCDVVK